MIKANELRIGNWVTWCAHGYDNNGFVNKELELTTTLFIEMLHRGNSNQIMPIPITKKSLTRLGFKYNFYGGQGNVCHWANIEIEPGSYKKEFEITSYDGLRWEFAQGKFPIAVYLDYVHQLQNLYFALTGEELIYTV